MKPLDALRWHQQRLFISSALLLGILTLLVPWRVHGQTSLFDSTFQIGTGPNGPVNTILVQPEGKILIGGEFTMISGQSQAYLARLNADGQLDTSFGSGTDGTVNRLLELPDGKILVAGEFTNLQGTARLGLGRLLTNGLVDLSFDASASFENDEIIRTICVQPDGKIVTASEKTFSSSDLTRLSRIDSEGNLDPSFPPNAAYYRIFALLPLPDGTILVGGGFSGLGKPGRSALALLHNDGQVDTNWPGVLSEFSTVFSLSRLTNGNILVGGLLRLPGVNKSTALAQLTPQWEWDTNFNAVEFNTPPEGGFARSLLVQPDGKIVVAGVFQTVGGYWRRNVARLDAQGGVDPCFDPGIGMGNDDGARAIARQNDGRVLVGGDFDSTPWWGVANLARLLPQSDCGMMRTYVFKSNDKVITIGTCPPGGTNLLQMSTNMVDWETLETQTAPYVISWIEPIPARVFFRVKKEF